MHYKQPNSSILLFTGKKKGQNIHLKRVLDEMHLATLTSEQEILLRPRLFHESDIQHDSYARVVRNAPQNLCFFSRFFDSDKDPASTNWN